MTQTGKECWSSVAYSTRIYVAIEYAPGFVPTRSEQIVIFAFNSARLGMNLALCPTCCSVIAN